MQRTTANVLSAEDIKKIKVWFNTRLYTRMQLAKIFGVTKSTAYYHTREFENDKKRLTKQKKQLIIKLFTEQKITQAAISKVTGICHVTIHRILKQNKIVTEGRWQYSTQASKLTTSIVIEIKLRAKRMRGTHNFKSAVIAKAMGLGQHATRDVIRGRTWKHVTIPL